MLPLLLVVGCGKDDETTNNDPANVILPTVVKTNPSDNDVNVVRNKIISVTFSEEMNEASIKASSFFVSQGSTHITGSIEYANKIARFIPNNTLEPNVGYNATITTGIKDLANNALAITKVFTFKTGIEVGLMIVNLRTSGEYVVLAKTAINNAPTSVITGDLGLSPAATSYITGFGLTNATGYATSPQVTGKVYAADMVSPTSTNLTTAVENMLTAYNDAAGRSNPDFSELGTGNIGGETLRAGLYKWTNSVTMPSNVVISGSADDVWIFQIAGDLKMSANVKISLSGAVQAKNVFWQVAGEVILGTTSHFEGIVLSKTGITM